MRCTQPNLLVFAFISLCLSTTAALASELRVEIEIPKLNVAEYHRPYVAVWIETDKGKHRADLSLWYDNDMKDNEGTKWLKDLRRWWRRSGRNLSFPVDALSSATRPVGHHPLRVSSDAAALSGLPNGNYQLLIEAAREVGGREVITLPFTWPPNRTQTLQQQGKHELGVVTLTLAPSAKPLNP